MVEDRQDGSPGGGGSGVDGVTVAAGIVLTVMGVAGVVVSVLTARPTAATGSVVWLLIGVLVLVFGVVRGRDGSP